MKKFPIRIISTQQSDTLEIRFSPTDICNFNCTYCFDGSGHIDKYRYPKDVELVIKNVRKLFDFYTTHHNKTRFVLMLTGGGEPTMWPKIEYFCRELKKSHNMYITVITNASRTIRWWEENYTCFDNAVLSCHNEFTDIAHHIAVADLLFEKGLKVTSLMVMDAKNWVRCTEMVDDMLTSKHSWYIESKPVVFADGHGTDT